MPNENLMKIFKVNNGESISEYPVRDAHVNIGYGECGTAAITTEKAVTITNNSGWGLRAGSIITVHFTYAVPSSATLNVESTGAKAIYLKGSAITNDISAGDIVTFIYDGTHYNVISIDRNNANIDVSGKADKVTNATNGNFAGLDSNGNIVDSGHKHSDYLTQHQNISGKADKVTSATNGNFAGLDSNGNLVDSGHKHSDYVSSSTVGVASGIAELDSNGKVPSSQLPSYVDDVIEGYFNDGKFYEENTHTTEITGETGKVYVDLSTEKTYRWSGSAYVVIGSDLALGETSSTAYRGDRGAAAYAAAVTNVESSPSSGSSNLITSGAVYSGLGAKANADMLPEEYSNEGSFPVTGATGKLYIAVDTNVIYRWDSTNSEYVAISSASSSGLEKETFSIATTDWTAITGGYSYTLTNSNIGTNSEELVIFDDSIEGLNSNISYTKNTSNHSLTFTVTTVPSGTISGKVWIITGSIEYDTKLDANQGSANAGKYMKVGNDGTLTPADVEALPVVTSSDNNKVLKVVSGDWAVANEQDISTKADKATSATAGNVAKFDSNGNPIDSGFTLDKSVPSDAVFTDTTYSAMTGASASAAGTGGLVPAPAQGDQNKVLKGSGTWGTVDALPAITSSDNGKVLEVVNGAWAKGNEKIDSTYKYDDFVKIQIPFMEMCFESAKIWSDGENIYYSDGGLQLIFNRTTSTWSTKTWNGLTSFDGQNVWIDGENIYYGYFSTQYVLNKSTSTWSTKTWTGTPYSFSGQYVWTDGDNIYYSNGTNQYVLNKSTSTWSTKTWTGLTNFTRSNIWTDGDNIYCSDSSSQYVLDKSTSTWSAKTWTGLTSFYGTGIWTDGENIYYSYHGSNYVLNKSTSTWSTKTWNGLTIFYGQNVWTDGENFYYLSEVYSNGNWNNINCALDKSTSTWSIIIWDSPDTSFYGRNVWTDGENIYHTYGGSKYYVFNKQTRSWSIKQWSGSKPQNRSSIWIDGNNVYRSEYADQYVLDKSTSTWSAKTWNGLTNFYGEYVWTDGDNFYYSNNGSNYVLDKSTSTWSEKTWTGLNNFLGSRIWTDGDNIYYSYNGANYVLDKSTSTWSAKTWNGYNSINGYYIWTDGINIYYSNDLTQYVLDKSTSTWSEKILNGLTNIYGDNVWTDGDNFYYSGSDGNYIMNKEKFVIFGENGSFEKTSLSDFKEKIGVTDLEEDVTDLQSDVTDLQSDVTSLNSHIGTLNSKFATDTVSVDTTISANGNTNVTIPTKTGYKPISTSFTSSIQSGSSGEWGTLCVGNPVYRPKDNTWNARIINTDSSLIAIKGTLTVLYIAN